MGRWLLTGCPPHLFFTGPSCFLFHRWWRYVFQVWPLDDDESNLSLVLFSARFGQIHPSAL